MPQWYYDQAEGRLKKVEDTAPVAGPPSGMSILQEPGEAPSIPGPADIGQIPGKDVISAILRGGAAASSFIPGVGQLGLAARMGMAPALSALASGAQGEDMTDEFTKQFALSGAGEGLSKVIPMISTPLALAFGGAASRIKGNFGKTVGAFNRQAERRVMPVLPGRAAEKGILSKVLPDSKTMLKKAGDNLEAAELASPATLGADDLQVPSKGRMSRTPISKDEARESFNEETVSEQVMQKLKMDFGLDNAGARELWENGPPLPSGLTQQNPAQLSQLQARVRDRFRSWATGETKLTTREVGELQRAVSGEAGPVLKAKRSDQFIPADSMEKAQLSSGLMDELKAFRHGPADVGTPQTKMDLLMGRAPSPGQKGAIHAADKMFSDYKLIDEANQHMRAGGILGDPGVIATRGSLGGAAGYAMGINPGLTAALAVLGLNPQAISGAGYGAAGLARYTPGALRTLEAKESVRKVKRKDPK